MTLPERYLKLKTLSEKATKGPWEYDAYIGTDDYDDPDLPVVFPEIQKPGGYKIYVPTDYGSTCDAAFIAEARNQIDSLLSDLEIAIEALEDISRGSRPVGTGMYRETMDVSDMKNQAQEALAKLRRGES